MRYRGSKQQFWGIAKWTDTDYGHKCVLIITSHYCIRVYFTEMLKKLSHSPCMDYKIQGSCFSKGNKGNMLTLFVALNHLDQRFRSSRGATFGFEK
jgi:hypothetical protein